MTAMISGTMTTAPVAARKELARESDALATVTDFASFRAEHPVRELPGLSVREVEVLLAWLAAESKEEAAARLFISASTVSTHVSRIRAKYANVERPAPTKAHLLARALQDGLTTLSEW